MAKTTYIEDLTSDIMQWTDDVKSGKLSLDEAKALANLSGKAIKSVALQIDYQRALKEIASFPEIAFMTKPKTAPKN